MTTSRLTSRSLVTRSSSLDLASGRITYLSKSKLTVDAVVIFSGFGAGFGGAGGGGGGGGAEAERAELAAAVPVAWVPVPAWLHSLRTRAGRSPIARCSVSCSCFPLV